MSAPEKSAKKAPKIVAKRGVKKLADDVTQANEQGARQAILEDLFYDFHRSRRQVYWMNFIRGLFFGLGSALGATLLVAITIWLLGQFGDIFSPIFDFINGIIEAMQRRR